MLRAAGDNNMRRRLSEYTPGSTLNLTDHDFQKICIQLFGMTGHGKSSLINSCLCVTQDREFINEAGSGQNSVPITIERKDYKITDTIYITDNRGLPTMNDEERQEIRAQFCKLRDRGAVSWERVLERTLERFHTMENWDNDIMLPVFVYSAECLINENRRSEIGQLLQEIFSITEIFPIIVLTHKAKVKNIDAAEKFKEFGANHVISIENYTTTNRERNTETDTSIWKFLDVCMAEAERAIEKKRGRDLKFEFIKETMELIEKEIKKREEEQEHKKTWKCHLM